MDLNERIKNLENNCVGQDVKLHLEYIVKASNQQNKDLTELQKSINRIELTFTKNYVTKEEFDKNMNDFKNYIWKTVVVASAIISGTFTLITWVIGL